MNVYDWSWPLQPDKCRFDIDLADNIGEHVALERRAMSGANIRAPRNVLHIGTGEHHLVGIACAYVGVHVLGVTASLDEHRAYANLIIKYPQLARFYKCIFTSMYLLDAATLPAFDVISVPHLAEFDPEAVGLDDVHLVALLRSRLAPGGRMIFYGSSMAWTKAVEAIRTASVVGRQVRPLGSWRTLAIFDGGKQ